MEPSAQKIPPSGAPIPRHDVLIVPEKQGLRVNNGADTKWLLILFEILFFSFCTFVIVTVFKERSALAEVRSYAVLSDSTASPLRRFSALFKVTPTPDKDPCLLLSPALRADCIRRKATPTPTPAPTSAPVRQFLAAVSQFFTRVSQPGTQATPTPMQQSQVTNEDTATEAVVVIVPTAVPTATPAPVIVNEVVSTPTPTPLPPPIADAVKKCSLQQTDIMLSLDRSGSMNDKESDGREKLAWAKDAMKAFVSAMASTGSGTIRIGVTSFGMQGDDGTGIHESSANSTLNSGLTADYDALLTTIDGITKITNGTCIECGIAIANRQFSGGVRKAVVLLSDGLANRVWDGTKPNAKEKAIEAAEIGRSGGIEYFALGFGKKPSDIDEATMQAIAGTSSNYSYKPDTASWTNGFLELIPKICE